MKIAPQILGRHLHDAAVDQLAETLVQDGYAIERGMNLGSPDNRIMADLVARRGSEQVVVEVKVLGDRNPAGLGRISQAAQAMGARFRLVVVTPQREVGIAVEDERALVLEALQAAGRASPGPLGELLGVEDVVFSDVLLRGQDTRLVGTAAVTGRRKDAAPGSNETATLPVSFTIWLDASRRLTSPPDVSYDLSDYDAPDA